MKKQSRQGWLIGGLSLALVAGVLAWFYLIKPEGEYPIRKAVLYSFTVKNTTNRLLERASFSTYAPVRQTSTQRLKHLDISHPYQLSEDALGNQRLRFEIENLPPYGTRIITVRAELEFAERPNRISINRKARQRYLGAEDYIETDDPGIVALAGQLQRGAADETAETIYRWVANNVEPVAYIRDDRGAAYALNHKKGDCTEYMYLYTALARVNGIPSRGVGGFVASQDARLDPRAYHNWSQVYLGKAWRNVDPQKQVFSDKQSHYVALRLIGALPDNATDNSHSLMHVSEGLKVSMNRPS